MKDSDSIAVILSKLDNLSMEIKALRSDASTTRSGVALLGLRLKTTETCIKAIQTDVSDIKTDIRRLEVLHEDTDSTIEHIAEVVTPTLELTTTLRDTTLEHTETLKVHNNRIRFLEKKIA